VYGDARSFAGEAEGDAATDAFGGAGDEDGFAGERHKKGLLATDELG
jgi:hypothetical protein